MHRELHGIGGVWGAGLRDSPQSNRFGRCMFRNDGAASYGLDRDVDQPCDWCDRRRSDSAIREFLRALFLAKLASSGSCTFNFEPFIRCLSTVRRQIIRLWAFSFERLRPTIVVEPGTTSTAAVEV